MLGRISFQTLKEKEGSHGSRLLVLNPTSPLALPSKPSLLNATKPRRRKQATSATISAAGALAFEYFS